VPTSIIIGVGTPFLSGECRQMRRTIYKFHKWLGLAFGMLLMAQAGSGVLLSFRPQLQAWELSRHPAASAEMGVNDAVAAVLDAFPGARPERVYVAAELGDPLAVRLADSSDPRFVAVWRKHDVLAVAGLPLHGALQWLFEWHEGLWWSGAGRWVLVFQAFLLMGFVVSGLYFWWPLRHKQGLKVKWRSPPVRRWYDVHRIIGICSAPFLVLAVLTGGTMAVRAMAGGSAPVLPVGPRGPVQVDEAFECAACGPLKEIRMTPAGGYRLIYASKKAPWPLAADSIAVSAKGRASPRMAQDATAAQKLLGWMYPLHTGKAMGVFGQLVTLVVGLALSVLPVVGGLLWLRRRPRKKSVACGA